jgi:hypothetical protein
MDGNAGKGALACASRASVAAMARLATGQSRAARSLDMADMRTVPEQPTPTCGSVVICYAVAAAACNKHPRGSAEEILTHRGGAVMLHALINCKTDVRAEAETWLPTCPLLRCPPESGVNSSEDTQTHRARRKPPPR